MDKKGIFQAVLFAGAIVGLSGCAGWRAGFMSGYTSWQAQNNYFLVGTNSTNFGYRQMKYLQDYHPTIGGFVAGHGLPDFIYAYQTEKGYGGFRFYYANIDTVYVFEERDNRANSIVQKEERRLTDNEWRTYAHLMGREVPPPAERTNRFVRPVTPRVALNQPIQPASR